MGKRLTKALALAQNGQQGEPSLKTFAAQLFVQLLIIGNGFAPFGVVVLHVLRVGHTPSTALVAIVAFNCGM